MTVVPPISGTETAGTTTRSNNGVNSKPWKELQPREKTEKILDTSFAWVVRPLCLISTISSVLSCVMTNLFDSENEYLDKVAEVFNRGAYFINGMYGAFENGSSNCLPGAAGFGLVSLSSIIGTKENMYLLKGPGSALDQVPAMLDEVGSNPSIIEKYSLESNNDKLFNKYDSFRDSMKKTIFATKFVCTDIYSEFKTKFLKGKIWDFFKEFIIKSDRREEKNLIVSSLGILAGVGIAIVGGLRRVGASIRDIFGIHADLGLFGKKNIWYKICGAFYTIGSGTDLVYRWTELPKLELAAVGMDNLGFMFMTWANKNVNRDLRSKSNINGAVA